MLMNSLSSQVTFDNAVDFIQRDSSSKKITISRATLLTRNTLFVQQNLSNNKQNNHGSTQWSDRKQGNTQGNIKKRIVTCYRKFVIIIFFSLRRGGRGSRSRHSYIGGWESTQVGRSCQVHDGTRGRDVILPETHLTALNSHKLMNKVGRATSEAARHVRQDVWKGFCSDFLLLLTNNLFVSLSVWRVRVTRMGLSVLFILFVFMFHLMSCSFTGLGFDVCFRLKFFCDQEKSERSGKFLLIIWSLGVMAAGSV